MERTARDAVPAAPVGKRARGFHFSGRNGGHRVAGVRRRAARLDEPHLRMGNAERDPVLRARETEASRQDQRRPALRRRVERFAGECGRHVQLQLPLGPGGECAGEFLEIAQQSGTHRRRVERLCGRGRLLPRVAQRAGAVWRPARGERVRRAARLQSGRGRCVRRAHELCAEHDARESAHRLHLESHEEAERHVDDGQSTGDVHFSTARRAAWRDR